MACEAGGLGGCDGAARLSHGGTTSIAGIVGPREAKASSRDSDESRVVVHVSAQGGGGWRRDTEEVVRQTLEALIMRSYNPMCVIDVTIQPLSDDGSSMAASINAAIAALIDAGVPLRFAAAAVCCAVMEDGTIVSDPSREQETKAVGTCTFVVRIPNEEIVSSIPSGFVQEKSYLAAMEAACSEAHIVSAFLRMAMEQKISRERQCWGDV